MVKKQVKKSTEKEEEQIFYVGLKDPIEIRRSILESSKEIVQYLQRFERFKKIRSEKAEEIAKLRVVMKDITKMVRKLKTSLPKTKLRAPIHNHEFKVKKQELVEEIKELKIQNVKGIKEKVSVPKKKQEVSELEKLEAELSEIESRLSNLA